MTLLLLGLFAVFIGLALMVLSVGVLSKERSGVGKSLAAIEAIGNLTDNNRELLDPTFKDRVVNPSGKALVRIARRFTPTDRIERLVKRMELAGMPREWTIDRVLAGKTLGLIFLGVTPLLLFLFLSKPLFALVFGISGALLGWFLPELVLSQMAHKRSERIQRSLPDNLDLLTISVEAGMAFDAALANVARNASGPLSEEFFRVLHEMQLGSGRMDALRSLSDRTDVEDLRIFVNSMAQADAFGIPIANVLRTQAKDLRTKRAQRAEERAMKIPVKMLFPLILFILPTLMVVIIGPAVVSIYANFISVS